LLINVNAAAQTLRTVTRTSYVKYCDFVQVVPLTARAAA
jgi:hypothetical protein